MPALAVERSNRLDEIHIQKEFNIAEAISSIQFYWNLARQRGETIVVEIWKQPPNPEQKGG